MMSTILIGQYGTVEEFENTFRVPRKSYTTREPADANILSVVPPLILGYSDQGAGGTVKTN